MKISKRIITFRNASGIKSSINLTQCLSWSAVPEENKSSREGDFVVFLPASASLVADKRHWPRASSPKLDLNTSWIFH